MPTTSAIFGETSDAPAGPTTPFNMRPGDSFHGEIDPAGDEDWVGISLIAGIPYAISLSGNSSSSGTLSDPYLRVYDEWATFIAADDDDGPGLDSFMLFTTGISGLFYLEADAYSENYAGTYTLSVEIAQDESTDAPTDDSTGYTVGTSDWFSGLIESNGDRDWISVELTAGQLYNFALLGAASDFGTLTDPYLRLYDSSGTLVASNDDAGLGLDSLMSFTPGSSGTYYVETAAFSDNYTGTYLLQTFEGTIVPGSPGRDILGGTDGSDFINGMTGGDFLDGLDGDDTLIGGQGNDSILGREGDDFVDGGNNHDNIALHGGDDTAFGGLGNDSIGGSDGNDDLYGGRGNDIIGGGDGDDYIDAGDDNDEVGGGAGNDYVFGGYGDDTMGGSAGDDEVDGWYGDDSLGGGTGDDTLLGYDGDDALGGGPGDDVIDGENDNDFLAGAVGNDTIYGGAGADTLNGGSGDDVFYGYYDGTYDGATDIFVFNDFYSAEYDSIYSFEDGVDLIRLRGVGPGSISIDNVTGGVEISIGGHTIYVDGMTEATLTTDDILFV